MSSPLASQKKQRPFSSVLITIHQELSHNRRLEILSRRIAETIRAQNPGAKKIRCLDVGCGDMQIAEKVTMLLPKSSWSCIDIHDLPIHLKDQERWKKYRSFDGTNIPFPDRTFDVVLFCDVLHHVQTNAPSLLVNAGRAGRLIIIKDHFEYSPWSRCLLRTMDFIGNWGYGISLPKRYFTEGRFNELTKKAGLLPKLICVGIDLYAHLPIVRTILRPKWQFIALLKPVSLDQK